MTKSVDDLCGELSYPMLAVSAAGPDDRDACLVGFSTQIGIDPWRYLVGLSETNHTFQLALQSAHLGVHFLRSDRLELAHVLGALSHRDDPEAGKSEALRDQWVEGPKGVPLLGSCPDWFVGRVVGRHPCGDHTAFVVEHVSGEVADQPFEQLDSSAVMDLEPGQEP